MGQVRCWVPSLNLSGANSACVHSSVPNMPAPRTENTRPPRRKMVGRLQNKRRPGYSLLRRNLWVTDTLQWAPEARLTQPANPMWDSAASAFPVRSQLPFELVCLSGKRYAVRRDSEMGVPVAPQGECERREGRHAATNPYRARYNRLKFHLHAPALDRLVRTSCRLERGGQRHSDSSVSEFREKYLPCEVREDLITREKGDRYVCSWQLLELHSELRRRNRTPGCRFGP